MMQSVKRAAVLILRNDWCRFSTSSALCGKRTRKPWDKRFPVRAEDVAPSAEGGSQIMEDLLPENNYLVAPTGMYHRLTGEYIHVPEMVPEFVVPDLTDFELKPYVSYLAKEIKQAPLTPREAFNIIYADSVEDDLRSGAVKVDGKCVRLKDGRVLDVEDFIVNKEDEAQ